ncbi:MAG: penicillin-binding protein 1C [Candidatus Kapaibacterium sp.]
MKLIPENITAKIGHYFKRRWLRIAAILSIPLVLFIILNFIFPLRPEIEYSRLVVDRNGAAMRGFLTSGDKWRFYSPIDQISDYLRKAVIAKEDKYFYYHPGINIPSIIRAAYMNITTGETQSGASTITMQVVRMLEPRPRTFTSKIIEAFRALQLELSHSKDEILEMYFNLAPYGGNIEGVRAASLFFFNKHTENLSLGEAVALAIVPNRPTTMALGENNPALRKYRDRWLRYFDKNRVFDREIIDAALTEKLDARRRDAPAIAPHLAFRAFAEHYGRRIIHTTIDARIQQEIARTARAYAERLNPWGIYNLSVLAVDNKSGEVIACVGSQDFFDSRHAGQVDGIRAVRSPGSTLKPLIYAAAIDRGLLTPRTAILDVPTDFGDYSPENFDESYRGRVSMASALANSLNVPAVRTLERIGTDTIVNLFAKAGFTGIAGDRNKLGLSLALGGCGVTLEQLVGLYSAFANGGNFRRISYIYNENRSARRIVSPEAAWLITQILMLPGRPDYPQDYQSAPGAVRIAWKTGTSYGRRDAWSIGYSKRYTIGVWVGNFDGSPAGMLTGAETATPLLFDIFRMIDPGSESPLGAQPSNLRRRQVCEITGLPPGQHCENTIADFHIPLVSPMRACDHVTEAWVSPDGTMSYCMECIQPGARKEIFDNPGPELINYYEISGIPFRKLPPHNPECPAVSQADAPKIINPIAGMEYLAGSGEGGRIMLKCLAALDAGRVHWFANNTYIGSADPSGEIFFGPDAPGEYAIKCCDDKGRSSEVRIAVRLY